MKCVKLIFDRVFLNDMAMRKLFNGALVDSSCGANMQGIWGPGTVALLVIQPEDDHSVTVRPLTFWERCALANNFYWIYEVLVI